MCCGEILFRGAPWGIILQVLMWGPAKGLAKSFVLLKLESPRSGSNIRQKSALEIGSIRSGG
eukprot:13188983-Alexandrium_andersonii.AAC.1